MKKILTANYYALWELSVTAKSDWIQSKIEIESETLAAKSDEFECDFSKILAVKYQNINFE